VVEKARATGNPVWTVYAANEGHGFSRRENRDWQQAAAVLFLRTFLLAPVESSGAAARRRLGESLGSASGRGEAIELDLGGERAVDHVLAIAKSGEGALPRRYAVEALTGSRWRPVAAGGVLDGERIHPLEPLRVAKLRLRVLDSVGGAGAAPAALELAAFHAVPEAARDACAAAREKIARRAPRAEAIADLDRAVEAFPEFPPFHIQRARLLEEEGRLEEARRDLDRALAADRSLAGARHLRANVHFKLGLFAAAVRDYDAAAAGGGPHDDDSCWERGLAWYYLGEFDRGRRQFEGYHRADHLDIENGIWRYLCIAEKEGLEKAVETFLPYPERVRPPFPALHDLFSGKGSPEAVLRQAEEAARSDDDRRTNEFYGHYYIGKYHEVRRERERAISHLREALQRRIPHFMYDCARIDLGRLEAAKGQ
jgi:lipoprotein NlpI